MTKKIKYGFIGFLFSVVPHLLFVVYADAAVGFPLHDAPLFVLRGTIIGVVGFVAMYFASGVPKKTLRALLAIGICIGVLLLSISLPFGI